MARKRSQHYLTIAIVGPLTLAGLLYVVHLVKTGDVHGLEFGLVMELLGWYVAWCIIWFILWITGTFKRWEEERANEE